MPLKLNVKAGRVVFTLGWLAAALGAVAYRSPEFWNEKLSTARDSQAQARRLLNSVAEAAPADAARSGAYFRSDETVIVRGTMPKDPPPGAQASDASIKATLHGEQASRSVATPERRPRAALLSRTGRTSASRLGDPSLRVQPEVDNSRLTGLSSAVGWAEPEPRGSGSVVDPTNTSLTSARDAARTGNHAAAFASYDAALIAGHGDEAAVALEAARFAASVQEPSRALVYYQRHMTVTNNAAGLRLELARTALAAGRPAEALRWTADAPASERTDELRYAEAQALHMTGKPDAAAVVLRELLAHDASNPEYLAWLARTSQARGRGLEAYELFGAAVRNGATGPDLLIARGDMAAQDGDSVRARRSYREAAAAGAQPDQVRMRTDALALEPQFAVPVELLRDSSGIELSQGGGQLFLWNSALGRIAGRWLAGDVRQNSLTFSRRAGDISLENVWLSPRLTMQGSLGVEKTQSSTLALWRAGAAYRWTDRGLVAGETFRETPWSLDPLRTALRFNRINDLETVGSRFFATGATARVELPLAPRQGLRADLTAREFSDGNSSRDLYVQFQQVLSERGPWIAIQPNLYVERWRSQRASYFSPEQHTSAGVTLRAIGNAGRWDYDFTLTPQVLRSQNQTGGGVTFAAGTRAHFGRVSAGANVMVFDDRRYAYRLRRFTADIRFPLAK